MSMRKILEEHLRGWLPKEPEVPENRLRRMRKPIAIFITATLLITSISFFASYSIFSRPPALPQPAAPSPTNTPNPSQPSTPSNTTPHASTSSPNSSSTSAPASTGIPGYWVLIVNEAQNSSTLNWNRQGAKRTYYPSEPNSTFLAVGFALSPERLPNPLDARGILFVVDEVTEYNPCGFSSGLLIIDPGYWVGNLTGIITSGGGELRCNGAISPQPLTRQLIFVYEVPQECFDGTHGFQLKIAGSSVRQNFTVPIHLSPLSQIPSNSSMPDE